MRFPTFLEKTGFLNKLLPNSEAPTAPPLPAPTTLPNAQFLALHNARNKISKNFLSRDDTKNNGNSQAYTGNAAATTDPSLGKNLSAEELAEKARVITEVRRRLSDAMGKFRELPPEAFDEIVKYLDLDAKLKLYEAGQIKLKQEEVVHWGKDHADAFSLAQLIDREAIPNLLTQQTQRRQAEREKNREQIDAAASSIKAIQASQKKGDIDEETALTKTSSVIDELVGKIDFAEHDDSTAIIAAAHAECIRKSPQLFSEKYDRHTYQSNLIRQLLKGISPRIRFHGEIKYAGPDDALLTKQAGLSGGESIKLLDMLEKSDRIKRADTLKESIAGLIQVLPGLINGTRIQSLNEAVETLAIIHNGGYATDQLADDIRSALEKLPLELMLEVEVPRQLGLPPSSKACARECIIRELPNNKLTDDQKRQFIDQILSEIKSPEFTPGGLHSEEAPYLFATVRQLTAILGKTDDELISSQVSELALKCLTRHNEHLDEETRAACIGAVKGLPLKSLLSASALPGEETNVFKALALMWNQHMKEIAEKKDPTREELKAAIEGFDGAMAIIYNKADKNDRALIVGAYLDGIRDVGKMQVTDPQIRQAQANMLMRPLNRSFTYRSKKEELTVIKASLIALNDSARLLVALASGSAEALNSVNRLIDKLNSLPPGAVDLSKELDRVNWGSVRRYITDGAKNLKPENKAAAISCVDALASMTEESRNNQTKGDLRGS